MSASIGFEFPRTDGLPRRAVTSINVRREEKALFDHLVTWWKVECGEDLSQWDAFSVVLAAALENPRLEVPPHLRGRRGVSPMSGP